MKAKTQKKIKDDKDIIVIVGNPPYNVSSMNELKKSKTEGRLSLLDFHNSYKPTDERNPKNINDDYIKFIAFAHKKIQEAGKGIIGVITNNSFLKGITHRKMRNELLKDFNNIYIIDLHGNSRIGETAPDGSKDENVFNIMQGVSIMLLVKKDDSKECIVKHIDLYGKREEKFKNLLNLQIKNLNTLNIEQFNKAFSKTKWSNRFKDDLSFFTTNKNISVLKEYAQGIGITDIFKNYISGVQTSKDDLFIAYESNNFINKIKDYNKALVKNISYRPFDNRYIYYDIKLLDGPRYFVMQHMLKNDNIGLIFPRLPKNEIFNYGFVSNTIIERNLGGKNTGSETYFAPLYLYNNNLGEEVKEVNFTQSFIKEIIKGKYANINPTPEQILGYIYAVLHSPTYRTKYLEFLKIDFPRIWFCDDENTFLKTAKLGEELINAHLLKSDIDFNIGKGHYKHNSNDTEVGKIIYNEDNETLFINNNYYFDKVPKEVWEFQIGGYQVIYKYLNYRKGKSLTDEDLLHVTKVINALYFTIKQMQKIDEILYN